MTPQQTVKGVLEQAMLRREAQSPLRDAFVCSNCRPAPWSGGSCNSLLTTSAHQSGRIKIWGTCRAAVSCEPRSCGSAQHAGQCHGLAGGNAEQPCQKTLTQTQPRNGNHWGSSELRVPLPRQRPACLWRLPAPHACITTLRGAGKHQVGRLKAANVLPSALPKQFRSGLRGGAGRAAGSCGSGRHACGGCWRRTRGA